MPAAGLVVFLGALLFGLAHSATGKADPPRRARIRAVTLVLFGTGLGALVERLHHQRFEAGSFGSPASACFVHENRTLLHLRVWVSDDPLRSGERRRFRLDVEEVRSGDHWLACRGRVRVSLRDPVPGAWFRYGDRLQLPVRLRRPRNFSNPGAFDYRRYLEGEGVHLLGSVKNSRLVEPIPGSRTSPAVPIHRLRERLLRRLARAFPEPEGGDARRFLEAILLGRRGEGEGRYESLFRKAGVTHILSISGLHFALLLALAGHAARRLPGGRILDPVVQAALGLLYAALSGGDDPILRAALAAGFLAAGRRLGRRISSWDAQAHAAVILLALHPLHLFDPGFQLSFAATWGILAGGEPRWPRLRRIRWGGMALATSASAWIASAPLIAFHFTQVSPVALVLNLPASVFLSGSLATGAALLVLPIPPLAALLRASLAGFSAACRLFTALPGGYFRIPPPDSLLLLAFAAVLAARLCPFHGRSSRRNRLLSLLALTLLMAMVVPLGSPPASGRLELLALDVGQGDALLLGLSDGRKVLVDGGGFTGTDFDIGEKVVLPTLLTLGVNRLHLIILTHAHQDHGGGLPAILESLPIDEVWIGRAPSASGLLDRIRAIARRQGIPLRHPTRGSLRCLSGTCFEVLHPPSGYRPSAPVSNDDSLVLRITYGGTSLLLTGDIEREGETMVLSSGNVLGADLLKVAHHGSSSSTSPRFLEAVRPRLAVISVGEGNLWGHPSPAVLARLARLGAHASRTDRDGAVLFSSDGIRWRTRRPE